MVVHETKQAEPRSSQPQRQGPLRVICFSTYVSEPSLQKDDHKAARNFLLALRGETVDGASVIPVAGEDRILEAANANDSIDWFGEMAAHYLETSPLAPPFALVPVPTSKVTLESSAGPWTSLLAISIAGAGVEADVVDCLRWKEKLSPSERRACSASELYEGLSVIQKLDPKVPVILVDYLFMSSATIRACARRLSEQGVEVAAAITAGRTASRDEYGAFSVVVGELSEFTPGH